MSQESKNEINVLVIGNGLDISLDYPTKYGDFLNFCEMMRAMSVLAEIREYDLACVSKVFKLFIDSKGRDESKLIFFSRFKALFTDENSNTVAIFLELTKDNMWISYFQKIYEAKTIHGENWIDLEAEIEKVILKVENIQDIKFSVSDKIGGELSIERIFQPDYTGSLSTNENEDMIRVFKENLRVDFDKFIVALDIYLDFFVSSLDNSFRKKVKQLLELKEKINYIICFNYRNNFPGAYPNKGNIETCMVHGRLKYGIEVKNNCDIVQLVNNNNMVIGFQDDSDEVEHLNLVYYRKYFQRIVKGTGNAYLSWFNEAERENKRINVYVFGHSLGSTDADIFRALFQFSNVHFTIFYYTDGKNTDLEPKVVNLVRILGKDKVINFTSGQDPVITFEEQRYRDE